MSSDKETGCEHGPPKYVRKEVEQNDNGHHGHTHVSLFLGDGDSCGMKIIGEVRES